MKTQASIPYPLPFAHSLTEEEALKALQSDPDLGLSAQEASRRNTLWGPNAYQSRKQKSVLMILLLQFHSPIVYLLCVAAFVTFLFGDLIESSAIVVVILLNAIIGFSMEMQARKSMEALKSMDVLKSKVLRDGKLQVVPAEILVPGDIIEFEAGDVIPADGRLLQANALQCEESSLTGESLPTEKAIPALPEQTSPGDRLNMVFKGTSVMDGNGKAIITGIANATELGRITELVDQAEAGKSPLDYKIAALTRMLIVVTLVMTVLYAITGLIQGLHWVLLVETSIALAVAAFPEGLPIVATVALAYGMLLMARRNAIVKSLASVETLGSTNVILTDKTGTLTENKIYADTFVLPERKFSVITENHQLKVTLDDGVALTESGFDMIRRIGVLCNNAALKSDADQVRRYMGDPLEIALKQMADASGADTEALIGSYPRVREIPFSADTKWMATVHTEGPGYFLAVKGSAEQILSMSTRQLTLEGVKTLTAEAQQEYQVEMDILSAEGLRVLAFAYAGMDTPDSEDAFQDLIFCGFIGFMDPPRLEIKGALDTCAQAGIGVIMVTGDHPLTALNIARKVGIAGASEETLLSGSDLPDMDTLTDSWRQKILAGVVFARTTPKQKLQLVGVFQQAGNIVAMTGDGVNDAPALKKSDIGIAMGLRGTQVAKETADIILKDDSFISIANAVGHGREIFRNIQKFVIYLVSCNLSEIGIVTLLGFIAPTSTLLPLQILFLNMVTDVFPALALGLGKGDTTVMLEPPKDPKAPIVSKQQWVDILIYAVLMTFAVLIAFFIQSQHEPGGAVHLNNMAFLTLALAQLFHVFNMASRTSGFIKNEITRNPFIWMALGICALLLIIVFQFRGLGSILGLETLEFVHWGICIASALFPVVVVQGFRLIRRVLSA